MTCRKIADFVFVVCTIVGLTLAAHAPSDPKLPLYSIAHALLVAGLLAFLLARLDRRS